MKNSLLFALLGMVIFGGGCSTAQQADQTVDDVYYSPGRPGSTHKNDTQDLTKQEQYASYLNTADDHYLRMKVAYNRRWSMLDDFNYWNDSRYDYLGYNNYNSIGWNQYYWGNQWNLGLGYGNYRPGFGWSNPTYTIISYYHPKVIGGSTSESNINAYRNKSYNNSNSTNTNLSSKAAFMNSNNSGGSSSNFGNLVKRVFSSGSSSEGSSSSSSTWDRAVRAFGSSSSSVGSSSGSSSSTTTSSSAGGTSGGVSSTGSSASSPRAGRNN